MKRMILFIVFFQVFALSPQSRMFDFNSLTHSQKVNTLSSSTYDQAIKNIGRIHFPYTSFHINDLENTLKAFSIVYDHCLLTYDRHFYKTLPQFNRHLQQNLYQVIQKIKGREHITPFNQPMTFKHLVLRPLKENLPPIILREEPSIHPLIYVSNYQTHEKRKKKILSLIKKKTHSQPFEKSLSMFNEACQYILMNQPLQTLHLYPEINDFLKTPFYPELIEFLSELAIQVLRYSPPPYHPKHISNDRLYFIFYYHLYHLLNALEAHELAIYFAKEVSEKTIHDDIRDLFDGLYRVTQAPLKKHPHFKKLHIFPSTFFSKKRNLVFSTMIQLRYQHLFPSSQKHHFLETYGMIRTNYFEKGTQEYSVIESASNDLPSYLEKNTSHPLSIDSLKIIVTQTWELILLLKKMSITNFDQNEYNCLLYHNRINSEYCLNDFDVTYFYSNPNPNIHALLFILTDILAWYDRDLIPVKDLLKLSVIEQNGAHSGNFFKVNLYTCIHVLQILSCWDNLQERFSIEKRDPLLFLLPFLCQLARIVYHFNNKDFHPLIQQWIHFFLNDNLQKNHSFFSHQPQYSQPIFRKHNVLYAPLPLPVPPCFQKSPPYSLPSSKQISSFPIIIQTLDHSHLSLKKPQSKSRPPFPALSKKMSPQPQTIPKKRTQKIIFPLPSSSKKTSYQPSRPPSYYIPPPPYKEKKESFKNKKPGRSIVSSQTKKQTYHSVFSIVMHTNIDTTSHNYLSQST